MPPYFGLLARCPYASNSGSRAHTEPLHTSAEASQPPRHVSAIPQSAQNAGRAATKSRIAAESAISQKPVEHMLPRISVE